MKYLMYAVLALGVFEILSNAYHLSKGSLSAIGRSAKRQHQEIPLDLDEIHFVVKAIVMLGFGLMFVLASLLFVLDVDLSRQFSPACFALFGGYGLVQAIVYRRAITVWPAALVYFVPLLLWLAVK